MSALDHRAASSRIRRNGRTPAALPATGKLARELNVVSRMTKLSVAVLTLGAASSLVGCRRLPETIPYEARLSEKDGTPAIYRVTELVGSELQLDGKPLGKLEKENTVSVRTNWSGPKADVRKVLNGRYTVGGTGACGPFALALEGPPPFWKAMSDGELAKAMSYDKKLPIFLSIKMPKTFRVLVDWGASRGTLRIGTSAVPSGTKSVDVIVESCASGPVVTLDGAPLGTIELSGKGALVTLEPNVCHVLAEVGYGDRPATKPATFFPAKGVVPLTELPVHFLESAPSSVSLYGSSKGTTSSELLRARCR